MPTDNGVVLIFFLPFSPDVSKNKTHGLSKDGHIYVTSAANNYKKLVVEIVQNQLQKNAIRPKKGQRVRLTIRCWLPAPTKKGGRETDCINYLDWLADCLAAGVKIDDVYFKDVRIYEVNRVSADEAKFQIILELLNEA